jgi:predicted RecA/RadA family phage recombinase
VKKLTTAIRRAGLLALLTMLVVLGVPTMALSADAQIPRKEGGLQSFPVEASTQIYKGALVCLNVSGYLVAAADTEGLRFVGVAYENILGTTQGAVSCRAYTKGVFKLPATSITQAMVGRQMFVVDDATVDESSTHKLCVGVLVEYSSTTSGWVDIGQRELLIGLQDHLDIRTDKADKNVRINSKTFGAAASIVGMQTKPRAGVNQTNDVIGIESMPGMGVTAITNSAGIVCFKAEPYIHATAGAITGDVRGYEATLGSPSGAGTITGTLSVLKAMNNTAKAVTGGIYVLHVITHGDAQPWNGLALLPDDGQIASSSENPSTINGWIKVKIGTAVRYIATYDSPTGG